MKILGLTGTAKGMTSGQKAAFARIIRTRNFESLHHGICVGADADGHKQMRLERPEVPIIGHPPINQSRIAAWLMEDLDDIREPKDYIPRNHDIVDESGQMIATPKGYKEEWRGSGTWATIRYSLKVDKPLTIIWPNGTLKRYNF